MKEFKGGKQVKNICMKEATFWVRVHDFPLMAHNEYIGHLVNSALGVVEEVNLDHGEVEWREYMRIIVQLDVTKPILRKKRLNISLLEPTWLSFSYDTCWIFALVVKSWAIVLKSVSVTPYSPKSEKS